MLILALDTTTPAGSVAVLRDDAVLARLAGDLSRTHGERLPDEIDRTLTEADVHPHELDLLVVASGPGAFTGLRIGLAAIQGMAMVLDAPVVGVSALDALASVVWPTLPNPQDASVFAWIDARRGEVFSAEYVAAPSGSDFPWHQRTPPIVTSPQTILESAGPQAMFVGDGAVRYRAQINEWSKGHSSVCEPPRVLATHVGIIGRRLAMRGGTHPPHALQPLYVRRPDAELERLRRTES